MKTSNQNGEAVIALMAVMALTSALPYMLPKEVIKEPICQFGYLYNPNTQIQIFSAKGGGVPCQQEVEQNEDSPLAKKE